MKHEILSFGGSENLKQIYIDQVIAHERADEIVKGQYWQHGKGCAVGCILHSSDHSAFPIRLGIPQWVAHLIDRLFEGMPNSDAKKFPRMFLEAIPVGRNLEPVRHHFCIFLMRECADTVVKLKINADMKQEVLNAIEGVQVLHQEAIDIGISPAAARWSAAATAATAAARWSVDAAAAAAAAVRWSVDAAYKRFADELIRILKEEIK